MVPTGRQLRMLCNMTNTSVVKLSKRTHLSRTTIRRAFNDASTDSVKILMYVALTRPDICVFN